MYIVANYQTFLFPMVPSTGHYHVCSSRYDELNLSEFAYADSIVFMCALVGFGHHYHQGGDIMVNL